MKSLKRTNLLAMAAALFLFPACGKEGPTGPEGPPGSGTSAVVYSDWIDIKMKADTIHLSSGNIDTIGFYFTIAAPKITANVLAESDVRIFINTNSAADPTIYSLPYNGSSGLYIEYSVSASAIDLYSNADVSTVMNNAGIKFQQYRYMIIPGGVNARKATNVDWSNYAEAKAYLQLKD
jgi:hypothetical protein